MKNIKKLSVVAAVITVIGLGSLVYATNDTRPVNEIRKQVIDQKKEILNEKVKNGGINKEEADNIIERMEKNQDNYYDRGHKMGYGHHGRGMGYERGMGFGKGCHRYR